MKTMNDYAIYCTEEQTGRALELGAPIKKTTGIYESSKHYYEYKDRLLELPTTQQIRGWLEECHGLYITANPVWCKKPRYRSMVEHEWDFEVIGEVRDFDTSKEAELAAIDAALDYLEKGETK